MKGAAVFFWRNGQPSVFMADKDFNGHNAAIAEKSRVRKEAREPLNPSATINLELETLECEQVRLARGLQ